MENVKELRENLKHLEVEIATLFSGTLKAIKDEIDFTKKHSDLPTIEERIDELLVNGELHLLPTLEARDNMSGDVFDIHVVSVNKHGNINVIQMNWFNATLTINLHNLASLTDKITLIEEMENDLNK